MRPLIAIVKQTIKSSLRSHVFHVLFVLTLLAVLLLPVTVQGDGTAIGELQISLTYSLGVVIALISTATLWLSCAILAREVESYNLHLVFTKPAPPWLVWIGKWLGVFLMHTFVLLVAAGIIFALVLIRIHRGEFPQEELIRVQNEVLVGRRKTLPDAPDFRRMAQEEYRRRLQKGDLDPKQQPDMVMEEILRQVKAKSMEVQWGNTRFWRFSNVKVADLSQPLFLRYRYYVGSTSQSAQRFTEGVWAVRDPHAAEEGLFVALPQRTMSGSFHELIVPAAFVAEDGTVLIGYGNEDSDQTSVIFQHADGPALLVRVVGFTANYVRSVLLAVLQLAFLAALGCTVGAAFSTPVAVFVAVSYLVIGMSVQAAVEVPLTSEFGTYQYKGWLDRGAHYIALAVSRVVISVDDFDAGADLARGRLIELGRIARTVFGLIVLRGGLMSALGMWILTRRELGLVIRR